MKKVKIIASDHNPVQVGDNALVDVKTKTKKRKPHNPGPNSDNGGKRPPKPPAWFAGAIQEALNPLRTDIQTLKTRLDKQDEFNREVSQRLTNLETR